MVEPRAPSPVDPPPPVDEVATKSEGTQPAASGEMADPIANPVLPATTIAVQQPVLSSTTTTMNQVTTPVQHLNRDPRFVPGAGQAFFSTELGARAPRSLGRVPKPTTIRSRIDPATVVNAASYWIKKYQKQCLCIFPLQGWMVEDLWDAEDLHVENREFCEKMLTFISRNTCHIATRFAEDWARTHPDRVDLTGTKIGNPYDLNDPLATIDQIFIFGEPTSFPRVFLWHVAHILRTIGTWIARSINAASTMGQIQQLSTMGHEHVNGGAELSATEVISAEGKTRQEGRQIILISIKTADSTHRAHIYSQGSQPYPNHVSYCAKST